MPWRELPARLNASNDFFIRTSDEGHKRFVRDFLQRMYDNGDIYQDVYAGLYCVGCEAFKTEDELTPDGLCPDHGIEARVDRGEELLLPALRLSGQAARALRRAAGLRAAGLPLQRGALVHRGRPAATSASRAPGQPWGIPLPWDESQVAYVWADALVNYLSALTYARPGEDLRDEFWPVVHHLLAKDILRFHCVFWPAMLLSAGYEPPKQLFVHGYLLLDDRKISKSLGNVDRPARADRRLRRRRRPVLDRARGLVRPGRRARRSTASASATSSELANDLGNLLSRTTAMVARYRDGTSRGRRSPTRRSTSTRCARDVAARIDASTSRARSTQIWDARPPAQPVRHGGGAVAAREGRRERGRGSTRVLYNARRRAHGGRGRARRRTCPRPRRRSSRRSARPTTSRWERVAERRRRRRGRHRAVGAALPADRAAVRRCVIDTHAHLDALDDDPSAVVDARARRGRDAHPHRRHRRRGEPARARVADAHDGVFAILGIHPHEAATRRDEDVARAARAARAPEGGRGGGDRASTGSATTRRATRSSASSTRSSRSPPSSASPSSSTRAPPTRTRSRRSPASTAPSSSTASRRRTCCRPRSSAAGTSRSPATRPSRRRSTSASRRAQVPADRILAETDCPYLAPQPVRGKRNEPAYVVHTLAALAEARGERPGRARGADRRERDAPASACRDAIAAEEGVRPALPRRREHPRRDRAARQLAARRRRARDRPGARRAHALPRRARRARARRRGRPLARAAPAELGDERRARFGDALQLDLRTPTRRSSSRTCPTTSRRRSSSRASTACRRSSCGA